MTASDEVIQKALANVEALEQWGEKEFEGGLPEIKLRGMPCAAPIFRIATSSGPPFPCPFSKPVVFWLPG